MYFKTYCFEEIQLRNLVFHFSLVITICQNFNFLHDINHYWYISVLFDKTTEILILFVFICSISCLTIIMDCFTPIELNKCIQYTGSCYLKLVLF